MSPHANDFAPPTWEPATLAEIAEVVRGVAFPREVKQNSPGTGLIACLRTANVQAEVEWDDLWFIPASFVRRLEQRVKPGDILISIANSRELVGKVAQVRLVKTEATIGAFIALVRVAAHLNRKFFFFQLSSSEIQGRLRRAASTTTNIANISTRSLAEIQLRVPPSVEQEKIVAEIERHLTRLDAAIVLLKRAHDNLKRYRVAVLAAACEGRLVSTEAELARKERRRAESVDPDVEVEGTFVTRARNPPALPDGWVWTRLGRLLTSLRNGIATKPDAEAGIPILRISSVRPLAIDVTKIRYLKPAPNIEEFFLEEGDLLFTRYSGNPDFVGACAEVRNISRKIVHPDKLIRGKVDREICSPSFLEVVLNAGVSRELLAERVRTTAGQAGISGGDLKSLPVPLPPISEQLRIAAEVQRALSHVNALEAVVEHALVRGRRLRKAILKTAFAGRLTPEVPAAEPASIPLERLRNAQRELRSVGSGRGSRRPPNLDTGECPGSVAVVKRQEPSFSEVPCNEQIDAVWESLFGRGFLEKAEAVRTAAWALRARKLANFQRLRQGGPLYQAIEAAIERGVREGDFDRPKRGHVRAILRDARDYPPETWSVCLLECLNHLPVEEAEALRTAAGWAREHLGLQYERLREDGVILRGLRAALQEALRRGDVVRVGKGRIQRTGGA